MTAIINATLVMRDHLIPNGVLLMENGKITAFGDSRKMEIPAGCEIIDAEGKFVGPGFVDIHTHSDGKVFFYDDPKAVGHHLKHGTTTIFPTMVSTDFDVLEKGICVVEKAQKELPSIGGIHLEGPYFSPAQTGAQNGKALRKPDEKEYGDRKSVV